MEENGGEEGKEGSLMPSVADIEWTSLRVEEAPRKGTRHASQPLPSLKAGDYGLWSGEENASLSDVELREEG